MKSLWHFLQYNNALPIAVTIILLGTTSTYAYNNPEVVLERQDQVLSIDNSYIVDVNFNHFSPAVEILNVTEDSDNYYIEYEFSTIALVDAVWQDVTTVETLTVPKARLGAHRDLGLYVTEQLNQKIKAEERRLVETQQIEQQKKSTKKVATKYRGLVGGFLSESVTEFDLYRPVVKPPKPPQEVATFARPPENPPETKKPLPPEELKEPTKEVEEPEEAEPTETPDDRGDETATQASSTDTTTTEDTTGTTTDSTNNSGGDETGTDGTNNGPETPTVTNEAPTISILGKNPVRVAVGESYTDLGAVVTDDHDTDLTVNVYVDGVAVDSVSLDTSTTTTYSIVYEAIDHHGASSHVERIVEVYRPFVIPSIPDPNKKGSTTDKSSENDQSNPPEPAESTVTAPASDAEEDPATETGGETNEAETTTPAA